MQLPCAHELEYLMDNDKVIPIEYIHWHWRFDRCPVWDSRRAGANAESEPSNSPQRPI